MALNPKNVEFLINQIHNADSQTFKSTVSQLFHYLRTEIKDNPVFEKYENEVKNWNAWPNDPDGKFVPGRWDMPENLEEAQALSYSLYARISKTEKAREFNLITGLFRKIKFSDGITSFNSAFLRYFELALKEIINANPEIEDASPKRLIQNDVFIIHGHDEQIKLEVQLLLKRANINSVVLHEKADRGRTVIDKLINEAESAGYAVALMSQDDFTVSGSGRARQNVVLEIGYFMGLLGKERVRLIVKGPVEIPSDLSGILYEKFDDGGAWKLKLLKEIEAVGIFVDIKSVIDTL